MDNNSPRPLSRRTISRSLKARPALRDDIARVTESVFVVGGEEAPEVKTEVVSSLRRVIDGRKSLHHEIWIEVDGVRLGEHASPPPMRGEAIEERIPQEQLRDYDELLTAFVPDHLAVDPRPRRLLKAVKRIPERLDKKTRYNTTQFLTRASVRFFRTPVIHGALLAMRDELRSLQRRHDRPAPPSDMQPRLRLDAAGGMPECRHAVEGRGHLTEGDAGGCRSAVHRPGSLANEHRSHQLVGFRVTLITERQQLIQHELELFTLV